MKIPDHIITEISDKVNIVELVSNYVSLKSKSGRYWGCCPFHAEKTPSFTVTPGKNVFYCFGCHKGGGIYNFLMEIEKLSFIEAVKMAGKIAGVSIPTSGNEDPERATFRESLLELYKRVSGTFHYLLMNDKKAEQARVYLAERGIDQKTIEEFQLGYAPANNKWLFQFLLKKNYSADFLVQSGLFQTKFEKMTAYFSNRIIFPITNLQGEVIAFGGRILTDQQPKYLNSPETLIYKKSNQLYGLHHGLDIIKKQNHFYIVEGYLDVLAMHQAGIKDSVAPLGTALTEHQIKLLKRYADKGTLIFDGDEAGFKATVKAIELLENQNIESFIVELPEKSDPADILQKDGRNRLNNFIKCSINNFEYLVKKAFIKFNAKTPTGKEKILDYLFGFLEKVNSEIKRDGYLNILAERLEVEPSSVRNSYSKRNRVIEYQKPTEKNELEITDELFLMLAIAVNRDYFIQLRKYIPLEILKSETAREIYIALEECFREDKKSLESLLEKVDNDILIKLILEKNSSGEYTFNVEKIIYDSIYRLKKRNLAKKQQEISYLLRKYEKSEPWRLKELLSEKMILDKEYEKLKVIGDVGTRE